MKDLTAPLGEENTGNDLDLGNGDSIYDQTRRAKRKLTASSGKWRQKQYLYIKRLLFKGLNEIIM